MTWLREEASGDAVLSVRIQPRAARDEIVGVLGDALKVRVRAPPEDGKANAALAELLGRVLGRPARTVEIVAGPASRNKRIRLRGCTPAAARAALAAAARDQISSMRGPASTAGDALR